MLLRSRRGSNRSPKDGWFTRCRCFFNPFDQFKSFATQGQQREQDTHTSVVGFVQYLPCPNSPVLAKVRLCRLEGSTAYEGDPLVSPSGSHEEITSGRLRNVQRLVLAYALLTVLRVLHWVVFVLVITRSVSIHHE